MAVSDVQRQQVQIVDTDVHPGLESQEQFFEYLPDDLRSNVSSAMNDQKEDESEASWYIYDLPDFVHAGNARYDSFPPSGGAPGSDPDFAFRQLIVDGKVDIAILSSLAFPMRLPEVESVRCQILNDWLVGEWLTKNNSHGRWRGSVNVCSRDPQAAVKEIERLGSHPLIVRVMFANPYSGGQLGSGFHDPIFAAATRHNLPISIHLGPPGPFEYAPISPVGQGSQLIEWYANSPTLMFASHIMSLIFDGVFERFPTLKIAFVEGSFTWILPIMWRMDAMWELRRKELPLVKRKPSEYVKEHIRFSTQPVDDPEDRDDFKQYLEWLGSDSLLMFSSDYPHATFDDPGWSIRQFPQSAVRQIMAGNAIEFYDLPRELPVLSDTYTAAAR